MPNLHFFRWFAVTMVTVCIPFFLMIGSLNTTSGMEFWRSKWHQFLPWIVSLFSNGRKGENDDGSGHEKPGKQSILVEIHCTNNIALMQRKRRSPSVSEAFRTRSAQLAPRHSSIASQTQPQVEIEIEAAPVSNPESSSSTPPKRAAPAITPSSSAEKGIVQDVKISWLEKLIWGRKKRDREHEQTNV